MRTFGPPARNIGDVARSLLYRRAPGELFLPRPLARITPPGMTIFLVSVRFISASSETYTISPA